MLVSFLAQAPARADVISQWNEQVYVRALKSALRRYALSSAGWTRPSCRVEHRPDHLRRAARQDAEELTLAELELSEAQVEQFDIDSDLAKAISVLNNASAFWIDASLEDRLRLQEVLVPNGPRVGWRRSSNPVTCLSVYNSAGIERSALAPHAIDGVQTHQTP